MDMKEEMMNDTIDDVIGDEEDDEERLNAFIFNNNLVLLPLGKLPTYPSPKPTIALTSHLGQLALGRGRWEVSQKHVVIHNNS